MGEITANEQERKSKHTVAETLYQIDKLLKKLKKSALTPIEIESLEHEVERLKAALLSLHVIKPGF